MKEEKVYVVRTLERARDPFRHCRFLDGGALKRPEGCEVLNDREDV